MHTPWPPVAALIFDFDGIIVDTETPAFESWQRLYAEYGHELTLDRWKDALGTNHGFQALDYLLELIAHTNGPQPPTKRAELGRQRQALKNELSAQLPLLPGVAGLLDQADALGLPCGVASSSDRAWVEGWLNRLGIRQRFGCVRTADDVRSTKPAPDLFLSAAAGLGVAPAACIVLEDSPNGIRAAHAANMRCVAIPSPITSQLELPPTHLRLPSLAALSLRELVAYLQRT